MTDNTNDDLLAASAAQHKSNLQLLTEVTQQLESLTVSKKDLAESKPDRKDVIELLRKLTDTFKPEILGELFEDERPTDE